MNGQHTECERRSAKIAADSPAQIFAGKVYGFAAEHGLLRIHFRNQLEEVAFRRVVISLQVFAVIAEKFRIVGVDVVRDKKACLMSAEQQ